MRAQAYVRIPVKNMKLSPCGRRIVEAKLTDIVRERERRKRRVLSHVESSCMGRLRGRGKKPFQLKGKCSGKVGQPSSNRLEWGQNSEAEI